MYLYIMKVKGFKVITLSVHLSVQLCPVIFLLCRKLEVLTSWFMILTQCYLGKFNVTGRKSAKFVSNLYLFYGEKWIFFLHTKTVIWRCVIILTMVKLASSMSLEGKLYTWLVLIFLWKIMRLSYFTKNVYDSRVCHDFV